MQLETSMGGFKQPIQKWLISSMVFLKIMLLLTNSLFCIVMFKLQNKNNRSNKVRQMLPTVFQKYSIKCESRALPVGDFLWIARWRNESGNF